jgi:hypothetical protein
MKNKLRLSDIVIALEAGYPNAHPSRLSRAATSIYQILTHSKVSSALVDIILKPAAALRYGMDDD